MGTTLEEHLLKGCNGKYWDFPEFPKKRCISGNLGEVALRESWQESIKTRLNVLEKMNEHVTKVDPMGSKECPHYYQNIIFPSKESTRCNRNYLLKKGLLELKREYYEKKDEIGFSQKHESPYRLRK